MADLRGTAPWSDCPMCNHAAPLTHAITPAFLDAVRYVAYEFSTFPKYTFSQPRQTSDIISLATGDWESPRVVSLLIVRDPIERLLSGDGVVTSLFGDHRSEQGRTAAQWWAYANNNAFTKNYQLCILSNMVETSLPEALQKAKQLTKRFTFVLDQACLDANLLMLARLLDWERPTSRQLDWNFLMRKNRPTVAQEINNATLLAYLQTRNQADIEFYNRAKQLSLVQCDVRDAAIVPTTSLSPSPSPSRTALTTTSAPTETGHNDSTEGGKTDPNCEREDTIHLKVSWDSGYVLAFAGVGCLCFVAGYFTSKPRGQGVEYHAVSAKECDIEMDAS